MVKLAVLNSHPIQYFAPLYRRLAQEPDIDLTVYFCSRQGIVEYRDADFGLSFCWDVPLLAGYRSIFLPNLRRGKAMNGFFSLLNPSIVRELRHGRYDALWVHGHGYATHLLAILTARLLGIPVLMRGETHLLLRRSSLKRRLRRPLLRLFYRHLCAACLAIGSRNEAFYRAHGVASDHLFLVPYVVDNDFFGQAIRPGNEHRSAMRRRRGLPVGVPVILFASKLTARKRPLDALSAYGDLRRAGIRACLVFVGSGEQEVELQRCAQSERIPDVHFLGFRNQSALPELYALADIFVLPSENEPWGLVINEVMSASLPVVAAAEIGAAADLVQHGVNGFVYRAGDIASLTHHLGLLARNRRLREEMGERSRQRIATWDMELCVQGVHEALRAVMSRRATSSTSLWRARV